MCESIDRHQLEAERNTHQFLLWTQYHRLFGRQLRIERCLGSGLFCTDFEDEPIDMDMVHKLSDAILEILEKPEPFTFEEHTKEDLIAMYEKTDLQQMVNSVRLIRKEKVPCVRLGDDIDYILGPFSTNTQRLKLFKLQAHSNGIAITLPTITDPNGIDEWIEPNPFAICTGKGIRYAADLNEAVLNNQLTPVRLVAEDFHSSQIAAIAAHLATVHSQKPIITIAGPSASNKTTTALRIATALEALGYHSVILGMDDYYKTLSDIPYGPDGLQDFEHISALDLPILADRIQKLTEGKTIHRRRFSFQLLKGVETEDLIVPKDPSFVIIEGINALNNGFLELLGRDRVTPIYVSALSPVNIDPRHRFPPHDVRLLRRMVRDYNFRRTSPRETLRRWSSVRKGEQANIFPYEHVAEFVFNSSLAYEMSILSMQARNLLMAALVPAEDEDPNSEVAKSMTEEAKRMLELIDFFYIASPEGIPGASCIREFIGGSELPY